MNAEVKYDTRDSKVDTLPEGVKYAICAVSGEWIPLLVFFML